MTTTVTTQTFKHTSPTVHPTPDLTHNVRIDVTRNNLDEFVELSVSISIGEFVFDVGRKEEDVESCDITIRANVVDVEDHATTLRFVPHDRYVTVEEILEWTFHLDGRLLVNGVTVNRFPKKVMAWIHSNHCGLLEGERSGRIPSTTM